MDPDDSPKALAQALDAVLDEAVLEFGNGNTSQAADLLVAAETLSDQLIDVLGGVDADEPND